MSSDAEIKKVNENSPKTLLEVIKNNENEDKENEQVLKEAIHSPTSPTSPKSPKLKLEKAGSLRRSKIMISDPKFHDQLQLIHISFVLFLFQQCLHHFEIVHQFDIHMSEMRMTNC